METLRHIFNSHNSRLIQKWDHYIEVYDVYFNRYRNKEVNILEIGVSQGGSIEMWKKYFGDNVQIFGVDINPRCKNLEDDKVKIFIGKQEDRSFWKELKKQLPKLDILIDDGGHTMDQQIVTFEEMFDHVKEDGIYLCEDIHTSYMYEYHGGYKKRGTFIEYSKNFIDHLHGFPSNSTRGNAVKNFEYSVNSVHYYRSMVIIEKKKTICPVDVIKGNMTVGHVQPIGLQKTTLSKKIQKRFAGIVRRIEGKF